MQFVMAFFGFAHPSDWHAEEPGAAEKPEDPEQDTSRGTEDGAWSPKADPKA